LRQTVVQAPQDNYRLRACIVLNFCTQAAQFGFHDGSDLYERFKLEGTCISLY
jgi:hypothetical protein